MSMIQRVGCLGTSLGMGYLGGKLIQQAYQANETTTKTKKILKYITGSGLLLGAGYAAMKGVFGFQKPHDQTPECHPIPENLIYKEQVDHDQTPECHPIPENLTCKEQAEFILNQYPKSKKKIGPLENYHIVCLKDNRELWEKEVHGTNVMIFNYPNPTIIIGDVDEYCKGTFVDSPGLFFLPSDLDHITLRRFGPSLKELRQNGKTNIQVHVDPIDGCPVQKIEETREQQFKLQNHEQCISKIEEIDHSAPTSRCNKVCEEKINACSEKYSIGLIKEKNPEMDLNQIWRKNKNFLDECGALAAKRWQKKFAQAE